MNDKSNLSAHVCEEIERWKARFPEDRQRSAVIGALHAVQHENDGYLTAELMNDVADYLAMPTIQVYEVATFYSMFQTRPVGRHNVAICTNVACMLRGADDIVEHVEKKLGIKTGANFLRNTKYWMLGMVLLVAAVSGVMAYELINPVSILHRGLIFGMGVGWLVIAGIFLFDVFVAKRGWCTHLCPMGAFYGLLGKVAPLRVRADDRSKCDDCAECFAVCPEPQIIPAILKGEKKGIPPVILSGECTNCGRCIDICGEDVFHFGLRFDRSKAALSSGEMNAALKQKL